MMCGRPTGGRRTGQQDAGDDGGGRVPVRVRQLAGEVGREDPTGSDQAEEPDDQIRVLVRPAREQEGQCGPEHAEGGEGTGAVPGSAP